ncbi:amphoterin-induced protein 2 [Orussus abietinus]|uniref:amphoterin-induced protein 2 n=1 Tax=Orussus abietinus TaxID=222816 RepID=UPI0006251C95|nr:amphoterin-induced protein 2 [Orussus abietinus]
MTSRRPWSTTTLVGTAMVVMFVTMASGLCPSRCKCDDEFLRASCAGASLDVVPIQLNPDIRHLDLSDNRVSNVHLTFGFYGNLESLDLSSNFIHTLGSDNFNLQQRLMLLNVSYNGIRTLNKNALKGLDALKELDLSGNNVTEMDPQCFRFTSELELLNLSGNSMISLPEDLLKYLHKIRSLILSKNSFLEIPTSNLVLTPSLERLDLSDNLIQELDRDCLPSLPSLVHLNLANNVIRSVSDDAFDGLSSLLHLDMSGNNLTSVPTAALAKLNVLTTLILRRNPLGSLKTVAFRNLFELRILDLDECIIDNVHARAFADNVNLERISLDGNHDLRVLPSRILYGARYLRRVSLRRCNLATLQPTHFPVDSLQSLRVGGNPFVCNCSMHWLWNVLRTEERRNESRLELDAKNIACADEENLSKPLVSLPEAALRCRLSPLYLSLSAAGCIVATAVILVLIAHITRSKRRKRADYEYAAPNRPELLVYVGRGHDEMEKNHESYSRRLIGRNEENIYDLPRGKVNRRSHESNIYDTPRFSHPSLCDLDSYERPVENGVYAVADVTNLRDEPPEVLSLYRMQSPPANRANFATSVDHDYERDFERHLPQKPHVVFV